MEKLYEKILKTPLFQGISMEDLPSFLKCVRPIYKSYKKKELIVKKGDEFTSIGLIIKGNANVIKESSNGVRLMLENISEPNMFGIMTAFTDERYWQYNVETNIRTEVIFIPRDNIVGNCCQMCPYHRALINNFIRLISEKNLKNDKQIEYLLIKSVIAKISAFLLDRYNEIGNKTIDIGMNRNALSEYLNVSRPTLSREIAKLKEMGIIDYNLNTFIILNVKELAEISKHTE